MCEQCGCNDHQKDQKSGGILHHHHDPVSIEINQPVLQKNDAFAAENRAFFESQGILSINLISSPGSGKTTLLERMAQRLGRKMTVVVGDIQTRRDADRIIGSGGSAYQIETQGACHLDAHMVCHALEHLDFGGVEICVIENVGNLVCPAAYDLGESMKIGILSAPEGDDKVLKYPSIFSRISVLLINKMDIAPLLDFDVDKVMSECKSLNSRCEIFPIAAKTGKGIEEFCDYLLEKRPKHK
jgi:hydrogenase nickel incorporation protein HypB